MKQRILELAPPGEGKLTMVSVRFNGKRHTVFVRLPTDYKGRTHFNYVDFFNIPSGSGYRP